VAEAAAGQRRSQKIQVEMLRQLAADPNHSVAEICKTLEIGRTTFYRYKDAEKE
jgi:ACT domain-containing protein